MASSYYFFDMTTTHVDDLSTWAVKLHVTKHVTKSGKSVTGFVKNDLF